MHANFLNMPVSVQFLGEAAASTREDRLWQDVSFVL
jgi:hypothetical protein